MLLDYAGGYEIWIRPFDDFLGIHVRFSCLCGDSLTKFVFKIVKIVIRNLDKAIKKTSPREELHEKTFLFEPRPAKSIRKNVILFLGTSAKRYAF